MQEEEEALDTEELYGNPQHETAGQVSEQELYGEPQHDVADDCFPAEFDPDFGHLMNWFDYPNEQDGLFVTER